MAGASPALLEAQRLAAKARASPASLTLSQALAWVCAPGEGLAQHNEKAPPKRGPQSIALRCRVTLPFAELRQMLLVDAIDHANKR